MSYYISRYVSTKIVTGFRQFYVTDEPLLTGNRKCVCGFAGTAATD